MRHAMKAINRKTINAVFESRGVSTRLNSTAAICLAFAASPDAPIYNLEIVKDMFAGLLLTVAAVLLISGCGYLRRRSTHTGIKVFRISGKPELTPKR